MANWTQVAKIVTNDGSTTIYGTADLPGITIESRKRAVPHANRPGSWDYTDFHVMNGDQEMAVKNALKDAKVWAEKHLLL